MIYIISFISVFFIVEFLPEKIMNIKVMFKGIFKHECNFVFLKFLFVMCFPLLLAVLRCGIGTDYTSYLFFFELQANQSVLETDYTGMELVFRYCSKILSYCSKNPVVFFGFFSIVSMYLYFLFSYKMKNDISIKYMLLFYLCFLYGMSFNIIRQSLSIGMFTVGLFYYTKDDFIKYSLFVVLGALIHKSAWIMLPIFFIKFIDFSKLKKLFKWIFIIVVIYLILNYRSIINILMLYSSYMVSSNERIHYSALLYFFEKILMVVPIFFNIKDIDKRYSSFFYIIFVDILLVIPGLRIEYLYRITYYFLPIYGIIIANFLKNRGRRFDFYKMYYFVFFFAYFILQYIYIGNHGIYPYNSIFSSS